MIREFEISVRPAVVLKTESGIEGLVREVNDVPFNNFPSIPAQSQVCATPPTHPSDKKIAKRVQAKI